MHSLQAQPTTKTDYKKTAIMVKYLDTKKPQFKLKRLWLNLVLIVSKQRFNIAIIVPYFCFMVFIWEKTTQQQMFHVKQLTKELTKWLT